MKINTLASALMLAEEHGLPVFPVKLVPRSDGKTDKIPLTAHGLLDASSNIERISQWWTTWPDAVVGVPTGRKTNIFLLDIDPDERRRAGKAGGRDPRGDAS